MTQESEMYSVDQIIEKSPPWPMKSSQSHWGRIAYLCERTKEAFVFNLLCVRSTEKYLRHLGARIGPNCEIQNKAHDFGSEPWLIEIGSRVTITHGVVLITHDGSSRVFRHFLPEGSIFGNRFAPIRVLDNSFIGVNAIILPGVTIGPNSIVGAGSVVNRDVPPNTVVAGVPARAICSVEQYIEKYRSRMVPIAALNRKDLRYELTLRFWGEKR
jgi:acetyltransferase-like isoleucine patch superfamily enzyme